MNSISLAGNGFCCPLNEEERHSLPHKTVRKIKKAKRKHSRKSEVRQIPMSYQGPALSQKEAKAFHEVCISIYAPKLIGERKISLTNSQEEDTQLESLLLPTSTLKIKQIGFSLTRNALYSGHPTKLSYFAEEKEKTTIRTQNLKELHFILTAKRDESRKVIDLKCKMMVTFNEES